MTKSDFKKNAQLIRNKITEQQKILDELQSSFCDEYGKFKDGEKVEADARNSIYCGSDPVWEVAFINGEARVSDDGRISYELIRVKKNGKPSKINFSYGERKIQDTQIRKIVGELKWQ